VFKSLCRLVPSHHHDIMGAPGAPASSTETSSSTSSGTSTGRDSIEGYPEIGGSVYWNPATEACCINMVGPGRVACRNSSSRYPTIRVSETSDARTPSNRVVRNLNPDFNIIWLQTIMESIQRLVPQDSPLVALIQQGVETMGQIVATQLSMGNQHSEPSIGNRSDN
jgi:hypothetical protein